jgi:tetratricopeptide (TPR) repeat protein
MEMAYYGLGEALRGQNDFQSAADAYDQVQASPKSDPDLRLRATLAAGQMYDAMKRRDQAIQRYQAVIAADAGSERAEQARRLMKHAYQSP